MSEENYLDITVIDEDKKELQASNDFYVIQMNFGKDIYSANDPTKYIRNVERMVRSNYEYTKFLATLKGQLNITRCSILSNLENVPVELHHYPFNLYEICEIVINKYYEQDKLINTFRIADEVMNLHYRNKVGLVPLTETMHELTHEKFLFLGEELIWGNWKGFIEEYKEYIDEDLLERIDKIKDIKITHSLKGK